MQVSNPQDNISKLEEQIQALIIENNALKTNNQSLSKEAEWLKIELAMSKYNCALLKHSIFGKSSEKSRASHVDQMSFLFNEAETYAKPEIQEVTQAQDSIAPKKKKAGRKALPENLPRNEIIHELQGEELKCDCGGELIHIGSETSEQLDVIPAKVIVNKHIRYKYACKCCEEVVKRAAAPFTPISKSIATPNLLAHIYTQKFNDHCPLYRQEHMWQRLGINLSRATMSNWILSGAEILKPIIELLKEDMNSSNYICSDETTINVLNNEKSNNYMWVHMSGNRKQRAVVYEYQESRSGSSTSDFFKNFKGYHQSDGYAGYNELHNRDDITGVGCMAHVRRKFMDIVKITKKPGIASKIIDIISKLYDIERMAKELPYEQIYQIRQERSLPIMEQLHQTLLYYQDQAPPTSILGKAINYPLKQWPKLVVYLENGQIRIDNNDCERAIKPFVIGRKNWLFNNTEKGAKASSIIFSIIETCKANEINSYNYLRYLFANIHKAKTKQDLRSILPYNIDPGFLNP